MVSALLSPESSGRPTSTTCAPSTRRSPTRTREPKPTSSACRSPRRAPTRFKIDWAGYTPPKPSFLGTRVFESYDLAELARYIDWTPFFQTWELKGRYPAILEDEEQGAAARQLFDDAQAMLERRSSQKNWFRPKAVIGFWPANAVGDDIRLFTDESRSEELATLLHAAPAAGQARRQGRMSRWPISSRRVDSGKPDYVGGFVVTAGIEEVAIAERFERANDDYSSILVKALADRFAEAFAERMHERVRKEFWGYAPDETLRARRADRRALPRHPPGARLSGAARPHREGDAVPPARRRAARSASS